MFTVAITPPATLPHEAAWILAMLRAGVSRLHVRKPGAGAGKMIDYLRPLVDAGFADRLAVHGHYEVAISLGVRALHFPTAMRGESLSEAYSGCARTTSTHSVPELMGLAPGWDYAFLSPIFPSISKSGYSGEFSESALRLATQQAPCRVVALGGIDAGALPRLAGWGFHGVAMLGALWQQPSLEHALRLIQQSLAL